MSAYVVYKIITKVRELFFLIHFENENVDYKLNLEAFLCQAHERVDVGVTFTAMPLTINISPPNIYFSFNLHCIIDEIIYLLNIIFIDIIICI